MIAFGIVFTAWITCWIGSFLMLVSSASGFFVLQRISQLILLAGFIVWAVCVVQVLRGVEVRLPVIGDWAARLTSRVYISPFQSSGSGLTERNISRCHLPPPHGSMTSVAMTSTRISANVRPSGSPSR